MWILDTTLYASPVKNGLALISSTHSVSTATASLLRYRGSNLRHDVAVHVRQMRYLDPDMLRCDSTSISMAKVCAGLVSNSHVLCDDPLFV